VSAGPRIHPTAIIDPGAELHESVEVGPYSVIGANVQIGEGSWIGPHVVLNGPLTIGRRNRIFQFSSIGEISQDMTARREDDTRVVIGDDNMIREYVTIQRGTLKDKNTNGVTRIGDHNWIMAYVHVAHDCTIGSHAVFANSTTFAGHVTVEDWVVLGGATLVHQFTRLGAHCFSAGGAGITRDIPPFVIVQGNPAGPRGINIEGIRRRGFSAEDLSDIKLAYRLLFVTEKPAEEARAELATLAQRSAPARRMYEFVQNSQRLIQR
jgi:UDP-N-acetylglucosamine acyltransferase